MRASSRGVGRVTAGWVGLWRREDKLSCIQASDAESRFACKHSATPAGSRLGGQVWARDFTSPLLSPQFNLFKH